MRILKSMAEKGNPLAESELRRMAKAAGVDPRDVAPLPRVAEDARSPAMVEQTERLRSEIDALVARFNESPSAALGEEITRKQIELNAMDPEAYFEPGSVKGEVIMRDFPEKAGASAFNSPLEALQNISNNLLNMIAEYGKALAAGPVDPYARLGLRPSFWKYLYRALTTARVMEQEVPKDLLAQAERIYREKDAGIQALFPTAEDRAAAAQRAIEIAQGLYERTRARLAGPNWSGIGASRGAADAAHQRKAQLEEPGAP
jgi:hypothetical protein